MISERFDPADAAAWIAHGRRPDHARILAEAWRRLPDLPPGAPADARMGRMRERTLSLRPVMEAMSEAAEAQRQAKNFAFTEGQIAAGKGDARDVAILRGRDIYGYAWDEAVRYAWGWYAAHAGWEPEVRRRGPVSPTALAYDQGFRDGGGNRDDLFDAARRAFAASTPPEDMGAAPPGKPRPSAWPRPSDEPRPARWNRRLLILGAPEAGYGGTSEAGPAASAVLRAMLDACADCAETTMIVITGEGFHPLSVGGNRTAPLHSIELAALAIDRRLTDQLRDLVGAGDFDDVLVAAQGPYLALLDAHAAALPLCRTMERTRNTPLQQRGHFRIWLDRGFAAGQSVGAGHIRWGKAVKGLTGKLGEFTARYTGKERALGHRIAIETNDGRLAEGYLSAKSEPLEAEIYIPNRAHLRKAMAAALRAFGGATRLHHAA